MRIIKDWIIPLVAIVMIGCMQMYSMYKGHDGVVLVTCACLIAGISGYKVAMRLGKHVELVPLVKPDKARK